MEKIYRYREVFNGKFSCISHEDWKYISFEEYLEIKEGISRGNQYQLQVLLVTHDHKPKELL